MYKCVRSVQEETQSSQVPSVGSKNGTSNFFDRRVSKEDKDNDKINLPISEKKKIKIKIKASTKIKMGNKNYVPLAPPQALVARACAPLASAPVQVILSTAQYAK